MTALATTLPESFTATSTAPLAPVFEMNARHRAAIADLPEFQRESIVEAMTANLDYVENPLFTQPSAERELVTDGMAIAPASTSWYHPLVDDELVSHSAPSSSLLTTAQEKHVFLRYNYARMRAQAVVNKFKTHPSKGGAREIVLWYGRVKDTREIITQANLALVLAMAKRTRMSEVDFGELVSEGQHGAASRGRKIRHRPRLQVQHLRVPRHSQSVQPYRHEDQPLSPGVSHRVRSRNGEVELSGNHAGRISSRMRSKNCNASSAITGRNCLTLRKPSFRHASQSTAARTPRR